MEVAKLSRNQDSVSNTVIKYIAKIAKIEEEIKEFEPQKKLSIRTEKAKSILTELHEYLINKQPHILPKSPLGVAVNYTLNQWPKLLVHLNDGRLENSRVENWRAPYYVSSSRSSNRTCATNASGFRTNHTFALGTSAIT